MAEQRSFQVAVIEKTVYIKPVGRATQDNSLGLPDFLNEMFRQGCTDVAFDFEDCSDIDSTFLGVIAAAAISEEEAGRKTVVVLNANERTQRELRMVGLMSVVALRQEPVELPEGVELKEIDFAHFPGDHRERVNRIKRLHEELIRLSGRNRELYASFVEMLDEELQQQDSSEG